MKKIVIPIIVITILILIGCFIFIPKLYYSKDVDKNDFVSSEKKEGQNNNLSTDSKEEVSTDVIDTEDNDNKENNNQTKNDNVSNVKSDSKVNTKDTVKDYESNDTTNDIDSKKEEIKEEKNNVEVPKEENVKTEITKNPWDELGISEYDYYHKPMWKWARIDYSIEEYKTYEKTREACIAKGEEYFNEGYGYSCTSINSYSGDYLGEMLKTF